MWQCQKCGRIFDKQGQVHSCQVKPLDEHFEGKDLAKSIFDALLEAIREEIGPCEVVSIPCCVHLYGTYDFLAALPKKDRLEVRFALNRALESPRVNQTVPLSRTTYKNSLDLQSVSDIDSELLGWLTEAHHLRDK